MRQLILTTFLLVSTQLSAQNKIDWDGIYKLQLSDFQSQASQIGDVTIYSLASMSIIDFSFYMTNGEFMFTKNFNSKVNCSFKRDASSLVAGDTAIALQLLNFARYDFDLAELYARKFRKRLYEEKDAFSDAGFFRPVYDEIQKEYLERHTIAAKESDLGRNSEKLSVLHHMIWAEIEQLAEFCKGLL